MEPDTVKTPKINRSTFTLGSGAIEKRVANNERKITVLKNIFKAQKVEIGDKITPKVNVLEESLVSTNIILEVIKRCFADSLETPEGHARMKAMVPSYDEDLTQPEMAARQRELSEEAFKTLNCIR